MIDSTVIFVKMTALLSKRIKVVIMRHQRLSSRLSIPLPSVYLYVTLVSCKTAAVLRRNKSVTMEKFVHSAKCRLKDPASECSIHPQIF